LAANNSIHQLETLMREQQGLLIQAATEQLLHPQGIVKGSRPSAVGDAIDHSGYGCFKNALLKTRIRQRLHADSEHTNNQHSWHALLDEPDSQMLADEAVREYELRRVVGLDAPPEPAPASSQVVVRQRALDTESVWQSMQEVPLEVSAQIDIESQVQRVRSGLRTKRVLALPQTLGCKHEP
jgi:hypothetical protein